MLCDYFFFFLFIGMVIKYNITVSLRKIKACGALDKNFLLLKKWFSLHISYLILKIKSWNL
jgi:hypothetical protein